MKLISKGSVYSVEMVKPQPEELDSDEECSMAKRWTPSTQFDRVVVWGHESQPSNTDAWVCSIEEWVSLSKVIHG